MQRQPTTETSSCGASAILLAITKGSLRRITWPKLPEAPAECATDKGDHSRTVLKALDDGPWKTRIAEPKQKGCALMRGTPGLKMRMVDG